MKLFSSAQVVVASMLGGPLAGSFLMSRNMRTWKNPESANRTTLLGLGFTLLLLLIGSMLPPQIPSEGVAIGGVYAMYAWYKTSMRTRYEMNINNGASRAPWSIAIAVGLIGLLCVSAVVVITVLVVDYAGDKPMNIAL